MSTNENRVEIEEEIVEVLEVPAGEEDLTDYKAIAARNAGIAKRYKTKADKLAIASKVEKGVVKELEKEKRTEKKEFDYAELAYLETKGVAEEDHAWLFEEAQTTGKSLKALLGFNYVKEELKGFKDARATKSAIPSG